MKGPLLHSRHARVLGNSENSVKSAFPHVMWAVRADCSREGGPAATTRQRPRLHSLRRSGRDQPAAAHCAQDHSSRYDHLPMSKVPVYEL